MKNFVLIFLLFVSVKSFSQTLDGFFGMKFGSSMDSIKKVMLSKPGCKFDTKNSTDDCLIFDGLKFAGRDIGFMMFSFTNNKFHTSKVALISELESKTVDLYKEIKAELNEKYFTTKSDYEFYKSPYEKGDGYTESAIKLGKAEFSSYWEFKNPFSTTEKNIISLVIKPSLTILIGYQDGILINEVVSKSKEKNFKDY